MALSALLLSADPPVRALRSIALGSLGVFLVLALGADSSPDGGGPLTWLSACCFSSTTLGPVALLPPISFLAWVAYRWRTGSLRAIELGPRRITLPMLALWLVAVISTLGNPGALIGLLALGGLLTWVYILLLNERPDLFWILAAIIIAQSVVAIAQFVTQGDLGWRLLGEQSLDPELSGISVVMRGGERWLRGYGLTVHPNTLARILILCLLMLLAINKDEWSPIRRMASRSLYLLGYTGVIVSLSRWGWVSLLISAGIALIPCLRATIARRPPKVRPEMIGMLAALLAITLLFMVVYGGTVRGRVLDTETPLESRSIRERERDIAVSLSLIGEHPWRGVGYGRYLEAARQEDAWALVVHSVPLLITAELGLPGGLAWGVLAVLPLWRRGAWSRHARYSALWIAFWLLGLMDTKPNPLADIQSALLGGMTAGIVAASFLPSLPGKSDRVASPLSEPLLVADFQTKE